MITRMPRSCVVHRAALLDFVDGQPRTDATSAALGHLERCRACEDELAGIVRTVAALRRLGRAVAAAEPPPGAWIGLRSAVTAPAVRARGGRWDYAAPMLALAIVAVVGLPAVIRPATFANPAYGAGSQPRLDAYEPRIIRLRVSGTNSAPVWLTGSSGHPVAPDGDRANIARVAPLPGSGERVSRPLAKT